MVYIDSCLRIRQHSTGFTVEESADISPPIPGDDLHQAAVPALDDGFEVRAAPGRRAYTCMVVLLLSFIILVLQITYRFFSIFHYFVSFFTTLLAVFLKLIYVGLVISPTKLV